MDKCPCCLQYTMAYEGALKGFRCLAYNCGADISDDKKSYAVFLYGIKIYVAINET